MDGIRRKNGQPVTRTKDTRSFSPDTIVPIEKKVHDEYHNSEQQSHTPRHSRVHVHTTLQHIYKRGIRSKWFRRILFAFLVWGVMGFIIGANNRTKVTIRPHIEYLDLNEQVTVYRYPQEDQLGFEVIAISDEVSIPVIASGERPVSRYAQGTVTIYNDYSTEPQRLLPETRFTSASGKVFVLGSEEVIIPGKTDSPGTVTAILYATEPGDAYNIDSTDFTLPGFEEAGLTDKYNSIYAFSSTRFEGGFTGTEPYVTPEQVVSVNTELEQELRDRLTVRLVNEKTNALMLIDGSTRVTHEDVSTIFDDESATGLMTLRGTIIGLGIGREHLLNFLVSRTFNYQFVDLVTLGNLSMSLPVQDVNFETVSSIPVTMMGAPLFEWVLDESDIATWLTSVPRGELVNQLRTHNGIDRAEVTIRPPWRGRTSDDATDIIVTFN